MLPGITGKSTLSATAHKKHSTSLLFRAVGKHSCCPKYYRKIIRVIHLGGALPVFDYLFLERLSHGGHHDFCSRSQVGRRVSSTLPFSPHFSLPFPFSDILDTHEVLAADSDGWDSACESRRDTSNWATLGLIYIRDTRKITASASSCIIFDATKSPWGLQ